MKLAKHFLEVLTAVGTQNPMMASANNTAEKTLHYDAEETSLRRRRKTSFSSTGNFLFRYRKFFDKKTAHFGFFPKSATKRTPNQKHITFAKTATKIAKMVSNIRGLAYQSLTQTRMRTLFF